MDKKNQTIENKIQTLIDNFNDNVEIVKPGSATFILDIEFWTFTDVEKDRIENNIYKISEVSSEDKTWKNSAKNNIDRAVELIIKTIKEGSAQECLTSPNKYIRDCKKYLIEREKIS